jgi:hypothetical protein
VAPLRSDGDGKINFKELSFGLKKLDPTASLEEARARAVYVMLLCDEDFSRCGAGPKWGVAQGPNAGCSPPMDPHFSAF